MSDAPKRCAYPECQGDLWPILKPGIGLVEVDTHPCCDYWIGAKGRDRCVACRTRH